MADTDWAAWRTMVDKALAGAPFDRLRTTYDDGAGGTIALDPLHPPAEPLFAGRPRSGPWVPVARVDADDGAAAQAREDLANGAAALTLVFAGAPSAHGRGLTAVTVDDLDRALHGVLLDLIPLHLEAGLRAREAAALAAALVRTRGTPPLELHLGLDPLGAHAAGAPLLAAADFADAVRGALDLGIPGTVLRADGRIAAEAGASPVAELAFAFASLAETLTVLDAEGIGPEAVLPRTAIALSATQDQFATIAKLRAARRLHRLVADACGLDTPAIVHATTAHRMLAVGDPHTNLLRLTIAAFAAGVGGADAVTVLPFDEAASPFGRRLARNIQNLLLEEAHVARLDDPAAGAGALEALTDRMAEAAWSLVQRSLPLRPRLADGGFVRGLALASAPVIIGVTKHPPKTPVPPRNAPAPVLPTTRRHTPAAGEFAALVDAAHEGATLADLSATATFEAPPPAAAFTPTRASAPHEAA